VSRQELLSKVLPESYAFEDDLESVVPPDGRIWLVWMRTPTYYLRRASRVDMVFEAWRFEALLDRVEDPAGVRRELSREGFTHLLVHGDFFLQDGNADLEPGRTARLQRRFQALIDTGVLSPVRQWRNITLFAVGRP